MHFYEYKGFIIYPTPLLSLESDIWQVQLSIRRGERVKTFRSGIAFATKGEAAFHSINFGKKVIDGEFEEHTINDLLTP